MDRDKKIPLSVTLLLSAIVSTQCPLRLTAQDGSSTSGRAVAKRFAELGILPDPASIVIEDIVNYHRHRIPLPKSGREVALDLRWDAPTADHRRESVLQIGYATERLHNADGLRPLNLALVIDESGSMAAGDKMRRVKQGLLRFARKLRPTDRISIVGYSNAGEVLLPAQRVGDRRKVLETIRGLAPAGSTNLHGGLMLGYEEVVKGCSEEADHRVILLTDGLANRGVTDAAKIAADSASFNKRGIDLSTIGVGRDFNQDLLSRLAKAGRGLFHFVADGADIEKVFEEEAQSLVGIVARDVTLELDHGEGIEIVEIYGYQPEISESGFSTPIENFNYGMTGVVMVKFRVEDPEAAATLATRVRVKLRYTSADDGKRVTLDERTRFLDPIRRPVRGGRTTDHEVRKNFTIAVMARATRRLAEAARSSRYGEAERIACEALAFYRRHYEATDDQDLIANYKTLNDYRKMIARRIERFRRL